jgi:hypothetical protein
MAAKLKPIKTLNEYNLLTGSDALGQKNAVVVFYDGGKTAAWKNQTEILNDLAGDYFESTSFIGVDARFFKQIMEQFNGAAEGKAAIWQSKKGVQSAVVVDASAEAIRGAIAKL